nr:glycosyltransferase family 4 protein [Citrobacter sp. C1]
MYPSPDNPEFGIFVANIVNDLESNGYRIEKCVRTRKGNNKTEKILSYFFFYINVLYHLIFHRYDYAYCHYVSHTSLPLLFAKALCRKIRVVSHVHGGDVKLLTGRNAYFHKIKEFLTKRILAISVTIVCPSEHYAGFLREKYNLSSSDVVIYPSGGVKQCFSYSEKEVPRTSNLRIGYAGRLVKSKNVDLIISAVAIFNNIHLSIVGDGEEEQYLYALAKNSKAKIEFNGPLSHNQLAHWFKNIDILIYPSDSESLGLVPLEAMSTGVYCILSDIPAFREFSDKGLVFSFLKNIDTSSIRDEIISFNSKDEIEMRKIMQKNSLIVNEFYGSESLKGRLNDVFR